MSRRIILSLMVLLTLALGAAPTAAQDAPTSASRLRVIHAAAEVPAVDVYVDDVLIAQALEFGSATLHFRVTPGEHVVDLRPAEADETSAPVFSQTVALIPDYAFSVLVQGSADAPEAVVYEDILDPIDVGLARLATIHAVPGADPVDLVRSDTAPLMIGVTYGVSYGTINIPAGTYDLLAIPTGGTVDQAVAAFGEIDLTSGVLYTLVAAPDLAFVLPTAVNADADDTLVRFANSSSTDVDLYVNGTLAIPNLTGDLEATPHIALPNGDHEIAVREAGTPPNSEALTTVEITLDGTPQTSTLINTADDELALDTHSNNVEGLTAAQARFEVLNYSDKPLTLTVGGAEIEAVETGAISEAVDVEPALDEVDGEALAIYGGVLYTVLHNGESTVIYETPLALGLTSLPFDQEITEVAAATPEATEEPVATEETTTPELAETEAVAETTPLATQPGGELVAATPAAPVTTPAVVTQVPVTVTTPTPPAVAVQPTTPPVQPPVVASNQVIGRVVLNQGSNLQCREYPSSQARSLGLIPNGTELILEGVFGPRDTTGTIGRTDAITVENVPDFSQLPTAEFSVANIPADQLAALTLQSIWVEVTWINNGLPVGCWSNAFYMSIIFRNERINDVPRLLELVDAGVLDITPYNVPGGPRDPQTVTAPPAAGGAAPAGATSLPTASPAAPTTPFVEGRLLINPTAQLNLRDRPSQDGTVRYSIPASAVLQVNGRNGDGSWLDVTFTSPTGPVNGWVSAQYVSLTFQGAGYTINQLPITNGEANSMVGQ